MLTTFALALLLQQNRSVDRLEKNDYYRPIMETKDAEPLIDSEPRTVVEKLDPIINNPKLQKHIESRARMAEPTGGYGDYFNFLPYQFRGRARMNLAKAASDPEIGLKLAQGAVADLEESVRRGVAPSEEFLKAAKAELEKAKAAVASVKPPDPILPVREDPLVKLRAAVAPHLAANRFKTARAVLEKEGKDVPAADKARLAEDVDRRCRTLLTEELFSLRRRFTRLDSITEIVEISNGAFDSLFSLPAPDELSVSDPTYQWAVSARGAFKAMQERKARGDALLPAALAAAKLDDALWFTKTEQLAYEDLQNAMSGLLTQAADLPKEKREPLKAKAAGLVDVYGKDFVAKLDPAFVKDHGDLKTHEAELKRLLGDFPRELSELAAINLESALAGGALESELLKQETELRRLEQIRTAAVESRRQVLSELVTVLALRALVAGKDEDAAAADARAFGSKLAALGGPLDAKRFGPRVEKVFEKLK
jgi:hypothetical protein